MHEQMQIWIILKSGKSKKALLLQTTKRKGEFWEPVTAPIDSGLPLAPSALLWTGKKTGIIFKQVPEQLSETVFYYLISEKPEELSVDTRDYQSFSWMPLKEVEECLKEAAHRKAFFKLEEVLKKIKS